ncbi:MAG: hypothetical protein ABII00_12080, partial [Elusimicrobiota bacterium]
MKTKKKVAKKTAAKKKTAKKAVKKSTAKKKTTKKVVKKKKKVVEATTIRKTVAEKRSVQEEGSIAPPTSHLVDAFAKFRQTARRRPTAGQPPPVVRIAPRGSLPQPRPAPPAPVQ